jgi:hypothetical protein
MLLCYLLMGNHPEHVPQAKCYNEVQCELAAWHYLVVPLTCLITSLALDM